MKNRISNKFDEKKTKIKERFKLKLEYSEKIKNKENSKILKKLSNFKNKELPKIKVLNRLNQNSDDIDSFNYNNLINNNSMLYKKIKNNEIKSNQKYNTAKTSNENLQNMNLISFNENINNIYKKVTINDFNNKEINQKMFYNMIQNIDNILEPNLIVDKKYEVKNYNYKNKIIPQNSSNNTFKNDDLLLSILNQSKEIPEEEEPYSPGKNRKNDGKEGNRFNFLRSKTIYNKHKYPNIIKKKYYTNKGSPKKVEINCDNDNNIDILETDQNTINKKILYEEDLSYNNNNNKNILKKSFDLDMKNKNLNIKKNKKYIKQNNSEEEESSDVTIESLCSEDIKDISSDFSNL